MLQQTKPTIAVSSWTFVHYFRNGSMNLSGFLAAMRAFDIQQVELNNHFFSSIDDAYISDLKAKLEAFNIRPVNLAIDDGLRLEYNSSEEKSLQEEFSDIRNGLASLNEPLRKFAIQRTKRWIDIAAELNCPFVRNNSGGPKPEEENNEDQLQASADSFRQLCDYAAQKGLSMIIENHGGFSSHIDRLDRLFELVDRPNLKQAVDFGNWPAEKRVESLERSFHRAGVIHPKMHEFDAMGDQIDWDHHDLARRTLHSAPAVPWVIEFEGRLDDAYSGLKKSIALIQRSWKNHESLVEA